MGRLPTPYNGGYSATKAVNALTDSLRLEPGPYGIRVTAIYAGNTVTHFRDNRLREVKMPQPSRIVAGLAR